MVDDWDNDKNSKKKENEAIETSILAPFSFEYLEKQLSNKNFGVLTTVSSKGKPHSVGVVYSIAPLDQPFALYIITRPSLKKARNLCDNPNVSFVVPFPQLLFSFIPPACIQFQGKAQIMPIDDPIATKAFEKSIVLKRSKIHSTSLGKSIFVRVVPTSKIFCFGLGARIWDFLIPSKSKNIGNFYVVVPRSRYQVRN